MPWFRHPTVPYVADDMHTQVFVSKGGDWRCLSEFFLTEASSVISLRSRILTTSMIRLRTTPNPTWTAWSGCWTGRNIGLCPWSVNKSCSNLAPSLSGFWLDFDPERTCTDYLNPNFDASSVSAQIEVCALCKGDSDSPSPSDHHFQHHKWFLWLVNSYICTILGNLGKQTFDSPPTLRMGQFQHCAWLLYLLDFQVQWLTREFEIELLYT